MLTFDHGVGSIDSKHRNFAGIASECVDPGGSINSQLRNFAGISSECVDPGVN